MSQICSQIFRQHKLNTSWVVQENRVTFGFHCKWILSMSRRGARALSQMTILEMQLDSGSGYPVIAEEPQKNEHW